MTRHIDMSHSSTRSPVVHVRVDAELHRELEVLARQHERSISGEVRLAARLHVERHRDDGDSHERRP